MKKLTFKQYLEEKEKLVEKIAENPRQTIHHIMRSYKHVDIITENNELIRVKLKPDDVLIVDWLYESPYDKFPEPTKVIIEKKNGEKYQGKPKNNKVKFNKWISKYSFPRPNIHYMKSLRELFDFQ